MLTVGDIEAAATRVGLGRLAPELGALAAPTASLEPSSAVPTTGSHFGGTPALPANVAWPEWKGRPLAFLAQVDLGELTEVMPTELLPREGALFFFYDANGVDPVGAGGTWGFDPQDAGSARVLWEEPSTTRFARPVRDGAELGEVGLAVRPTLTLPPAEIAVDELGLEGDERDAYWDLIEEVWRLRGVDELDRAHHLLGHPDQVQGDMTLECQLVTNGLYCGDGSGALWGDLGRLYFWMREADLRRSAFDRAWTILQCT